MNKALYILLFIIITINISFGQDAQMSQYYAAPLYLAPSFAGGTDGSRVSLNYRNQWGLIPGGFNTYMLSYDHYFSEVNSGLGVLLFRDQAGEGSLRTTNIGLQYSYNLRVSKRFAFRPGVYLKYSQKGINFSDLVFGDQMVYKSNTSIEMPPLKKVGFLDLTVSGLAFTNRKWIGFSLDHVFEPNESLQESESKLPRRISIFGGSKYTINNRAGKYNEESLSPTFMYKKQGEYDQLDIGLYWSKRPFVVGFWYRGIPILKKNPLGYMNQDAIVVLAGFKLEDLRIGYSYDLTISGLTSKSGGSHEISIIYEFLQDKNRKKKRKKVAAACPKF